MTEFYEVLRGMIILSAYDHPSIYCTIDCNDDETWSEDEVWWYDIVNISITGQVNDDEREQLEALGWVWDEGLKLWTKRWKSTTRF